MDHIHVTVPFYHNLVWETEHTHTHTHSVELMLSVQPDQNALLQALLKHVREQQFRALSLWKKWAYVTCF